MSRRERWLVSVSLALGVLLSMLGVSAGVIDFGGARAETPGSRPAALAQDTNAATVVAQADNGSETTATAPEVIAAVSPAVVTVINVQQVDFQNGDSSLQPVGSGTGFVIDTDGHIVTNWHVVNGGSQFEVVFADGTTHEAELVGSDQVSDLAVVKIDGGVPAILPLGDSDAVVPGEPVLALGSPLGNFQNTVTQGIVSAINRDFPYAGQSQYNNLIQHDAAINPGNSGGPLVNFNGEVIGVNTLGLSVNEQGQPIQGLFFAIPSNSVKDVSEQLIENGEVTYPFVGISFQTNTPATAAQANLSTDQGVVVLEVVPDGPADDAGVQVGDVILRIGDYDLNAQTTFSEALFQYGPDDTVELEIVRDNETITTEITLGERPQNLE